MVINYFDIFYDFITSWAVVYIFGFLMTNYYSKKIYDAEPNNISLCKIPKSILWLIRPNFRWYKENEREKPSLRIGVFNQVIIFVISIVCLVLMIVFSFLDTEGVYIIFKFWDILIPRIFIASMMILLFSESLKLFYIYITEKVLGRKLSLKEMKKWQVKINDVDYTITFIKDYYWRGYRLDINGEIVPLLNSPFENVTGLDIPIKIGEKEARFIRSSKKTGKKMDLVIDGYFVGSGEKYIPNTKKPFLHFILKNRWRV